MDDCSPTIYNCKLTSLANGKIFELGFIFSLEGVLHVYVATALEASVHGQNIYTPVNKWEFPSKCTVSLQRIYSLRIGVAIKVTKVKSAYKPSGPSGLSLSWFL